MTGDSDARRRFGGKRETNGRSRIGWMERFRSSGLLWLFSLLVLVASGCGGSSSGPDQAADKDDEEEAEEKPAAAPAPKVAPAKQLAAAKAAPEESPAPKSKNPAQWDYADLKGALARKDLRFPMGVVLYGAQRPSDSKRAEDLDALLRQVGKMKDDAVVGVPLPPGALATTAAPVTSGAINLPAAAAMPAPTAPIQGMFGNRRRNRKD